MKYERRLIFAVVLKASGNKFVFNELRAKYRRHADSDEEEDNTIAGRAKKSLSLGSCFSGFSSEEILSGDDKWYCNVCKEHRDITKKLEIFSAPKVFVI